MSFIRDFRLIVYDSRDSLLLDIKPPTRISFNLQKSISGGLNKLNARIYGLIERNRNILTKDVEKDKLIKVILLIGHQGKIKQVFLGNLHRGNVSLSDDGFISEIECYDGGYDLQKSFTSKTVYGGQESVRAIIDDMPNTEVGKITQPDNLIRPRLLVGNSVGLLKTLKKNNQDFFIDDNKVYLINNDDTINDYRVQVNSKTGLMTTPTQEQRKVNFDMIINADIKMANLIVLESDVDVRLSGVHRVVAINYQGDNFGEDWKMSVECYKLGTF